MAGIYFHIPFCASRCIYCDFFSTTALALRQRYVNAASREVAMRLNELSGETVSTIYIGGGTPSMLTAKQIAMLISQVPLDKVTEFTVEVNPDDITPGYIKALAALGANRISMGVQSFNDAELQFIGRRHNAAQAIAAFNAIRQAGISNISIDLMYGLPMQTLDTWVSTIKRAISLGATHISAYSLMFEPGTRLLHMRKQGIVQEATDELALSMYTALTHELHAAGFSHYEISNFAKNGHVAQHNANYWNLTPYLGIGAAAHSLTNGVRRYNPSNLKHYIQTIEAGTTAYSSEHENLGDLYDEYIMLCLRTMWGVQASEISQRFKQYYSEFSKKVASLLSRGDLESVSSGTYRIPEAKLMVSDAIIRFLMHE